MKTIINFFSALVFCLFIYSCSQSESNKPDTAPKQEENQSSKNIVIEEKVVADVVKVKENKKGVTKDEHRFILGKWVGNLRDKKITIVIESIEGDIVSGYNIVGKNHRPLSGKIMEDDRDNGGECLNGMSFKTILKEPGDDKWDGFFTIYFADCPSFDELDEKILSHSYSVHGEWKSFSGKLSGEVSLSK
jgi:hypothetical protein